MKKILILFVLLSCMVAYGKEYTIIDTRNSNSNKDLFVNSVNWGPYMHNVEQKIKNNWKPPINNKAIGTVVKFTIAKDGKLIDSKIIQSSDVASYDKAALDAIQKTSYEPLPKEFDGESIPIEFAFDYHLYNTLYDNCKTKFCKFIYKKY